MLRRTVSAIANRIVPRRRHPVVSVLPLHGIIGPSSGPFRPALSLAQLAGPIEQAFAARGLKAVALSINSPGGSPVQSALIHDRIRALAAEKDVPVFAFCEDVAASGGYWLACAGDHIYANPNSIVGSIGVISAGFGFEDLLRKVGIERRVHTAGDKKSFLDPFQPEQDADVKRLKSLQKEMHDAFKAHIRARRGERLQASERQLFTGAFWTGEKAKGLGLIDGFGDLRGVMRERFGDKVRLRVVGARRGWLRRRIGLAAAPSFEVSWSGNWAYGLLASLEARALWRRFGL